MSSPEGSPAIYHKDEPQEKKKTTRLRMTGAAVVTLGVLVVPPVVNSQQCDNPTPNDMHKIGQLFKSPEDPRLKDAAFLSDGEDRFTEIRLQAAKKHGLTVHDHREFTRGLVKNNLKAWDSWKDIFNPKHDFSVFFNRAHEFLQLYDVNLVTAKDGEKYDLNARKLTEKELESNSAKKAMLDLIYDFADLPVEFVRKTGRKEIVLASIPADEKAAAYTHTGFLDDKIIVIDPNKSFSGVSKHELFHGWDKNTCGSLGMDIDPEFKDLNPSNIYSDNKYSSREEYDKFFAKTLFAMYSAKKSGDEAWVETVYNERGQMAENVVVARDYGFESTKEDKATLGEALLTPLEYEKVLDKDTPVLRDKSKFILARLYSEDKKGKDIVEYFAEISNRPQHP